MAGAFFVICSLIFTWPLLPNITRLIAGETDVFQLLGSTYNAAKAWQPLTLLNPLEFAQLFNVSTHVQIYHQIFGEPLGYNLFWLTSFILTGLGTYWLAYYLTRQHIPALIAGLIFTLSPIHFALSSGFYGIGHLEWLPLYTLFLLKYFKKPGVRSAVFAAVFFLLSISYDEHWLYLIALFTAGLIIYELIHNPELLKNRRFQIITSVAIGAGLSFVLVSNQGLIQLVTAGQNLIKPSLEEVITYSNDVAGFYLPYAYHPIWGGFFWQNFTSAFTRSIGENTGYLGIIVLILSSLAVRWGRPKRLVLFWLGIAAGFAVLSLGPFLKVAGAVEPKIPLPYLLLYRLVPFTDLIRGVGRFLTVGLLGFSVLAAFGASSVIQRINSGRGRTIFTSIVMLLIVFDFLAAPRLSELKVPEFYNRLAREQGDFNIIQIPSVTSYNPSSYLAYYNSQHDKGVIGKKSYFSRDQLDEAKLSEIRSTPVIGALLYDLPQGESPSEQVLKQDYRSVGQTVFRQYDVKYIILHKNFITDNPYIGYGLLKENYDRTKDFIESSLPVRQYYDDPDTLVYKVEPFLTSGDDLYLKLGESWESSTDPVSWRPFILGRSNSSLTIQNNGQGLKKVRLNLSLNAVTEPARLGVEYHGRPIGDYGIIDWPQTITIYLANVPVGTSTVSLSVRDWNDEKDDGLFSDLSELKVTDISYDTIDAIAVPGLIRQIADEPGDFSILQVAAANTYRFDPASWGDKEVLGKRLLTVESPAENQAALPGAGADSFQTDDQPALEHLFGRALGQGWEKINSARAYSELYYYLLSEKVLRQNRIKYLLVDQSLFSSDQLIFADSLINNFAGVSEKIEADGIIAYRLNTGTASIDPPALTLNGKNYGNRNNQLTDGSALTIQLDGPDWSGTTLNGQIINPTEQARSVRWFLNETPLTSLNLEPGPNKFSLSLDNLGAGSGTLTFIDRTAPQFDGNKAINYPLSLVELYPSRFSSLADFADGYLRTGAEGSTIDFESADHHWSELRGTPEPIIDLMNGNRAVSLKPSCEGNPGANGRCLAQVRHYFSDFTNQVTVEAFVKLDRWPENGRLALRFVNNGAEYAVLTSPTGGEGHSPTISSAFPHDFKIGEWNRLKITYQPGGEFTLSENGIPLFWCQSCIESRPLGFFVQLETGEPDVRLDVDFIQYERTYLKPE